MRRVVLIATVALGLAVPASAAAQADETVHVGAYINDVQQLDLQTHSYTVDMYLWFEWCDESIDPSRSFEFMNSYELWGHILTYESEEPEERPGGCLYQALRNQGKFNAKLPLADYPFDTQTLSVELESTIADASELRFAADTDPIARNPEMTLPGYNLGTTALEVVDFPYRTNFGDDAPNAVFPAYSRVVIEVPVTRPAGTYATKLLLPIFIVLIAAGLMFVVRPDYVEGRIGIGITALLTLVALQLTTNSALPDVNYLLMMDKIYIASYAFIVVSLALVARTSWLVADLEHAIRFDRRSLLLVSASYIAVLVAIVATQLA